MTDQRKRLGRKGEDAAVRYLEEHGYRILERNFHCAKGEIDIIAEKDKELVFVEVRSRSILSFGDPSESVSYRKQQRLRLLALIYLQKYNKGEASCSFDVITVHFDRRGEETGLTHYPRAF